MQKHFKAMLMAGAIGVAGASFAFATPAQLGNAGQVLAYGANTIETRPAIAATDRLPIILAASANEAREKAEPPEKAEQPDVEVAEPADLD